MGGRAADRPAVVFFASFALGLATAFGWWHGLLVLAFTASPDWRRRLPALLAGLALGIFLRPSTQSSPLAPMPVDLTLRVASVPQPSGYGQTVFLEFQGDASLGRIRVKARTDLDLSLGDEVKASGRLRPPDQAGLAKGFRAELNASRITLVKKGPLFWQKAQELRLSFRAFLAGGLEPRTAGLLSALCFGGTADIIPEDREAIREAGAAHMVAASGANILLVAGVLLVVFWALPIPRLIQLALLAASLVFYAGAAGLESPIVRALLMAVLHLGAELVRREPDPLSSASAAGSIGLILDPRDIADVGFWLSYGCVFALILWGGFSFFEGPRNRSLLKDLAWTSLVAGAAAAPVTGAVFGVIPLYGALVTVVTGPLVGGLVLGGLGLFALWPLAPGLAESLLTWIFEPLLGFILAVFHTTAGLPGASIPFPSLPPILLAAGALALLLCWKGQLRPARE